MTREPSMEQSIGVLSLREGDIVKLTTGETAEFVRAKAKNFIGIMNSNERRLGEKASIQKEQQRKENSNDVLSNLKAGDWFYINKNGEAMAFQFKEIQGKCIIGINPITKTESRIDIRFEIGKIE